MTNSEERQLAKEKAIEVIPYLTGNWRLDESKDNEQVYLFGDDDMRLFFHINWRDKKRLVISGSFSNGLNQYMTYYGDREKAAFWKLTI